MRIISVTNQKGGCGKTTTALNLAACLAANNKKVLLIDLDPQAHATLGLNIKADLSIYNVLSKLAAQKTKLEYIIQNIGPNFYMAPSGIVLSVLEQELAGEIGRESRLNEVLADFKGDFDYILIDCPPNLGLLTINAIRATNEVIIPVEASRFSLEGLSQLMDIINLVKERLNHGVSHHILVTNFDSRLRHSFSMLDKIKAKFRNNLLKTIIHVNVKLKEAQNDGTHILVYDKYSRGAKDYWTLSREIITQEYLPEAVSLLSGKMEKILKKELPRIAEELPKSGEEPAKGEKDIPRIAEVDFSFAAPEAKEVYLAGDFNDWKTDTNSRMDMANGVWSKKMVLLPGRYRYRFVIDGNWVEDPGNPEKLMNPYGQMDSLVQI